MTKRALIVIDVQMCMFDPDYPVYDSEGLLKRLQALIAQARQSNAPVIYVQHCGAQGAPHEPGQPGFEIHPAIAPLANETIVQKRMPDSFFETSLQSVLAEQALEKLVIAGIQSDYCVDTTCRAATSLGYDVTLVEDAHSTWGDGGLSAEQIINHHNRVLGNWFATVKPAAEIEFEGESA